jgi:hypothetical protein
MPGKKCLGHKLTIHVLPLPQKTFAYNILPVVIKDNHKIKNNILHWSVAMQLYLTFIKTFGVLLILFIFLLPASAMDDPGFVISRMVMCESVSDKEPVHPSETFPVDIGTVYCFLEAVEIEEDTTVSFAWYYENREMARITLPLEKGRRWRTFSSKKLEELRGNWKVELVEASGIVLNTLSFQVQ